MPRLSIIVPYQQNASELEGTLLSLLENRPPESEIIVVHNGTYDDPYRLHDEVIFVVADRRSNRLQLLNAGLMAACSPAICVLADGAVVGPQWSDSPLELLFGSETAAVAVALNASSATRWSFGIDSQLLARLPAARRGRVEATTARPDCSGPALVVGFYRRRVLLALGGWNESLDEAVADVELGLALQSLGLDCRLDSATQINVNVGPLSRRFSATALSQLASLAAAHGAIPSGWGSSLKIFVADCLQGRFLAAAAWASGLRDASTIRRTQLRLNHAKQQLNGQSDGHALRVYRADSALAAGSRRRAA